MLSVAKLCSTHVIQKTLFIKPITQFRTLLTSSYQTVISNHGAILAKPTSFILQKGLLRRSGTVAVNFTSKIKKKPSSSNKVLGSWLLISSGMVFIAVVLGIIGYILTYYCVLKMAKEVADKTYGKQRGVTRLTESGLSMVTWRLFGEKRPTSEDQWIEEFERYKQYPEYKMINRDLTLQEFKRIWWMEYLHRTWGRLIGGVFIVPAAYFWYKGWFNKRMKIRVTVIASLIGLQGLMGWYMVKSGLEDRFNEPSDVPRVSPYRLASHLSLAFGIYAILLYSALDHLIPTQMLGQNELKASNSGTMLPKLLKLRKRAHMTKGMVFLTAVSGAFVAGLDAGLIYNTFPKMADKWIPDDLFAIPSFMKNFTENPTTVQFDHRILGITTLTLITSVGIMARKLKLPGRGSQAVAAVLIAGYLQVLLGISTLLSHVPTALAASHQSGSLLLLSATIWLTHELRVLKKLPK